MDVQRAVGLAQDVLAVGVVMIGPFIGLPAIKRLKQFSNTPGRLALYRKTVFSTWALTVVTLTLASFKTLFWVAPQAHEGEWLQRYPAVHYAVATSVTALLLLSLWPGIKCAFNVRTRARYRKGLRSLMFMLPVTRSERLWWVILSVTAGICEELFCRGFLLQYLRGHLEGGPALGLTLAWLVSSMAFGLGHFYQGLSGIVRTTIAGLMLGLVAILTGNLLLPILLHCILDLQILFMYHPAKDSPEDAPALISGFCPQSP